MLIVSLIFVLAVIFIWFCISYLVLIKRRFMVIKYYGLLDILLRKRSKLIEELFTVLPSNSTVNELINRLNNINSNIDNADRRLAFEYELAKNISLILSESEGSANFQANEVFQTTLQKYNHLCNEIVKNAEMYNKAASSLKYAVEETFPLTFLARMSRIKSVNKFII